MPELVFLRRGEEVLRFALDRSRVVLGRGDHADVVIPDPEVSRQQAAVLLSEGGVVVEDLSGKGTVVAGARSERAPLADGADIALGQWRAVYRAQSPAEEPAATEVRGTQTDRQEENAEEGRPGGQLRLRRGGTDSAHRWTGGSCTLGKEAGNDLVVDDRFISARHLRIGRKGSHFVLVDQGSTNGTWLGPVRIFEAEVPLNTTVRIGETEVVLEAWSGPRREGPTGGEGVIGSDPAPRLVVGLGERGAAGSAAGANLCAAGTGARL